jgi:hypothetical protein
MEINNVKWLIQKYSDDIFFDKIQGTLKKNNLQYEINRCISKL